MNYAELLWIRAVQRCSFPREMQYLKSPCPVLVNQFRLFLDDQQVLWVKVDSTILCCAYRVRIKLASSNCGVIGFVGTLEGEAQWCFRHSDILLLYKKAIGY